MKKLSELAVGDWGVIQAVEGKPALRRRLETMGFIPGTRVRVSRCAPMGDPRAYELLGYCISLRQEEAEMVIVEPIKVYPLSEAPPGRFKIVGISGGRGLAQKLANLGILPDVVVVRKDNGQTGPVTVEIQGQMVQIGRGMARRITVIAETDEVQKTD